MGWGQVDSDRDGVISAEELSALLRKYNMVLSNAERTQLFRALGIKGGVQGITYERFIKCAPGARLPRGHIVRGEGRGVSD
jgi:Ca2+-binding EF-hand superfamily protein